MVLPDTQFYSMSFPYIFNSQTEWIKNNTDSLNVRFVIHEGDIVNNPEQIHQWDSANRSISVLDGVVPYSLAVGNHDDVDGPRDEGARTFNEYFPPARFELEPWYGGHAEGGNHNSYSITE